MTISLILFIIIIVPFVRRNKNLTKNLLKETLMFQKYIIASVSFGLLFTCSQVEAGIVDLTTIDSLGVIDGAVFYQFNADFRNG